MNTATRRLLGLAILFAWNAPVGAQDPLISAGSEWRMAPVGTDPGPGWRSLSFDDSEWQTVTAPVGYGENGLATLLPVPSNPIPATLYFRRAFLLASVPGPLSLCRLRVRRDDGVLVHLDGEELWRNNMPTGAVSFTTLAVSQAGGSDETRYMESAHRLGNELLVGENIIAVELHQSSLASMDTHFDLALDCEEVAPCFGNQTPPAIVGFEFGETAVGTRTGALHRLQASYRGLGYAYQWTRSSGGSIVLPVSGSLITGEPLPSGNALAISAASITLQSSPVDLRNATNVTLSVDLLAETIVGFTNEDRLTVDLFVSDDGIFYRQVPWLDLDILPAEFQQELVGEEEEKRVLVPDGEIDPAWRSELGFEDASWISGSGNVGFDLSTSPLNFHTLVGIGIDLEDTMHDQNGSAFVRIPFRFDGEAIVGLFLNARYDDGFAAWLNGVPIAEANAPASPVWNSVATRGHGDSLAINPVTFDASLHLAALRQGENLLAIQAMNQSAASTDFLLSAQLVALKAPGEPSVRSLISSDTSFVRFTTPTGLIPDRATSAFARLSVATPSEDIVFYLDNLRIQGTPVVPQDYESFVANNAPPAGDLDDDGRLNFLEYALGDDPFSPGGFDLPDVRIDSKGRAIVRYPQLAGRLSGDPDRGYQVRDVVYRMQISEDGRQWRDGLGASEFRLLSMTASSDTRYELIELRTVRPVAREKRQCLFRLLVEHADPQPGSDPCGDPFAQLVAD